VGPRWRCARHVEDAGCVHRVVASCAFPLGAGTAMATRMPRGRRWLRPSAHFPHGGGDLSALPGRGERPCATCRRWGSTKRLLAKQLDALPLMRYRIISPIFTLLFAPLAPCSMCTGPTLMLVTSTLALALLQTVSWLAQAPSAPAPLQAARQLQLPSPLVWQMAAKQARCVR
jgi:hypothetical protein